MIAALSMMHETMTADPHTTRMLGEGVCYGSLEENGGRTLTSHRVPGPWTVLAIADPKAKREPNVWVVRYRLYLWFL